MDAKIDISSKTIEKCLDVAKEFLQKLIGPGLEEAGLLIRENVAMWRFNNQVSILQKANEICERKGITPTPHIPKASLSFDGNRVFRRCP